ncbi:unnamed protein product [Didymodactylos carnosus]|uniref:Uncharacterized protein n=1 Tax=Didymodactylos carnosus TaxID=1234261 RepID=A0A8S2RG15_9BILA|nr:unnamed protein product [Didymodactylos carnosus]CAF4158637.1 unnamed protein product [Didymodactylos carnosus]
MKKFLKQLAVPESLPADRKYRGYVVYRPPSVSGNTMSSQQTDDDENENAGQNTNDDFLLYKFQHVLLEKKEKILLPIFDIQVPYKDIYHCKIDPTKQLINAATAEQPGYGEHKITCEHKMVFVQVFSELT